jgi:hypothetical protein
MGKKCREWCYNACPWQKKTLTNVEERGSRIENRPDGTRRVKSCDLDQGWAG